MLSFLAYSGHFGRPLLRNLCQRIREVDSEKKRENFANFITASCGFPKEVSSKPFVRHNKLTKNFLLHSSEQGLFGDDAFFVAEYEDAQVIGVADGVGGWRDYGVDVSRFSKHLMKSCEHVVKEGHFTRTQPVSILSKGFCALFEEKVPLLGSATVCIVVLDSISKCMYSANLGDSGFLVVRKGSVVHRSLEQQHVFNTPYQLAIVPPDKSGQILSDPPESADVNSFYLHDGDVIVVGTDGLFDNLPENLLLGEIKSLQSCSNPDDDTLKATVGNIASKARQLARDPSHFSPFSERAREHGYNIIGGKPDDITVLLSYVNG